MKLEKHQVSSFAGNVSRDLIVDAFGEAMTLTRDCRRIYTSLNEFKEKNIDEFDLMDEIEAYASFDIASLSRYCGCMCSKKIIVNKYMERVLQLYSAAEENLRKALDVSFCISDEELDAVIAQLYGVIAGTGFFCLVEFDVFDLLQEDGSVCLDSVDEILVSYSQTTMMPIPDLVEELLSLASEFKPRFDIFDSYPELEDEFQKIMGPNIIGVNDEYLTIELVQQVINGNMTPEELVLMMAAYDEEGE